MKAVRTNPRVCWTKASPVDRNFPDQGPGNRDQTCCCDQSLLRQHPHGTLVTDMFVRNTGTLSKVFENPILHHWLHSKMQMCWARKVWLTLLWAELHFTELLLMPQGTQQWAHWRAKAPTDVELHWNPDALYSLQASDCNHVMLALYMHSIYHHQHLPCCG